MLEGYIWCVQVEVGDEEGNEKKTERKEKKMKERRYGKKMTDRFMADDGKLLKLGLKWIFFL